MIGVEEAYRILDYIFERRHEARTNDFGPMNTSRLFSFERYNSIFLFTAERMMIWVNLLFYILSVWIASGQSSF